MRDRPRRLRRGLRRHGLEFRRDQRTYEWYGRFLNDWHDASRAAALRGHDPKTFGTCLHAVRVPGASYEIGLVASRTGMGYDMIYDAYNHGGGIERVLGVGCQKLVQTYRERAALRQLQKQGYRVTGRMVGADGEIHVQVARA